MRLNMILTPKRRSRLELLASLTRRNLEAKYKGSVLGNLWPIVHQLAQLAIYTYVFSVILKVKLNLEALPSGNVSFGLWLYAGLLPWTAFLTGLTQASAAVISNPNLVKKIVFPLNLLPLVPILSAFVEGFLGFVLLLVLLVVVAGQLHGTALLMPLVWLPQLLLTAGLGYLTAGVTVFIRDIPQTLVVLVNIWFYLTPIVYPISVVPEQWRGWVLWLNPLATIVELYRELLIVGRVLHPWEWLTASIASVVIFVFGRWVYGRLRPGFADTL
jgi:lipopolysaccharide transport system permease protein